MSLLSKIARRLALYQLPTAYRQVVEQKLTYLSAMKLKRLQSSVQEVQSVDGDLVEFGVALGGSAILLARSLRDGQRFHGFDVFSMIPPPTSDKDDQKSKERYKIIESGASQGIGGEEYYGYRKDLLSDVKASFARFGTPVDNQRIVLHQGLFEDTWAPANISKIAFAHIDCDWYDPVKFCLNACKDILGVGGILLIDDYNDYGGCRTAVDEFLLENPQFKIDIGANAIIRKVA